MDMKKRRDMQLAYISDEAVMEEQKRCRKILQRLNFADRSDFDGIAEIVKELLGKSENAWINPPFYCDYGSNIETGKNFAANYNCMILDVAKVKIGDNCFMAPNVAIYTAGHPIYPDSRNTMFEYGKEVTIGDNDFVGRYGGDEFMAVIYNASNEKIKEINEKLDQEVKQFNKINHRGDQFDINYAHGCAFSVDYDQCTFLTLFNRADKNMYKDKMRSKNLRKKS